MAILIITISFVLTLTYRLLFIKRKIFSFFGLDYVIVIVIVALIMTKVFNYGDGKVDGLFVVYHFIGYVLSYIISILIRYQIQKLQGWH